MTNRRVTIENTGDVVVGLFKNLPDEYICKIKMELRRLDKVEDVAIPIMLKRPASAVPSYVEDDGEHQHFRTTGHWPDSSEEFRVTVIIWNAHESAELSLPREADEAFERLPADVVDRIRRPIEI